MELSFKVNGLERLRRQTKNAEVYFRDELVIALEAGARKVESEAATSILRGNKTGRQYRVRSVLRRASAPGEAPANQTRRLVGTLRVIVNKTALSAIFSVGGEGQRGLVRYARALEFGTVNMEARPFFFPAVERSKAWIKARLEKAVARAIKRSGK